MKPRAMTHRVFLLNPKKLLIVLLVFSLAFFLVQQKTIGQTKAASSVPAFPGAEGFGAESVGGRGGRVIEVTNLNNSGSGSLRACVETGGPRTCVFRIGGTIDIGSKLTIDDPFITIAGQTAPGGGIAVKGELSIKTHDVVIRYIRTRSDADHAIGILFGDAYNIIIDHTSLSWGSDEVISTYSSSGARPHNLTIQWSIISEGLLGHSKGFLSGRSTKTSVHHSIFAHNDERSPRVQAGDFDFVNNIVYNWGGASGYADNMHGSVQMNYIGNYIKPGGDSNRSRSGMALSGSSFAVFVEGNIAEHSRPNDSLPEWDVIDGSEDSQGVSSRLNFPSVTTTSALDAYEQVLANAGATLPMRDAVDARIVNDVRNGTGEMIDAASDVGGWPDLAAGTPYVDSDHDGMADDWELSHFSTLDRGSPDDSSSDFDGDGYTDLEEYLNGTNPKDSEGPSVQTQIFLPFVSKSSLPPTPGGPEVYEAENASLTEAEVSTRHSGFTGSGFVNFLADSGASIKWTNINVPSSGNYTLTFRYALGKTGDRPIEIKVNGSIVESSLNFPDTGDWSNWRTLDITTSLNSGTNTIEAVTIGYDGPNIDHLEVQPSEGPSVQTQIFFALRKQG